MGQLKVALISDGCELYREDEITFFFLASLACTPMTIVTTPMSGQML